MYRGMMSNATKSWRTTLMGLTTMLTIIAPQFGFLLDDDPETVINLNVVAVAIQVFVMGLIARDNGTSSEAAGANRR